MLLVWLVYLAEYPQKRRFLKGRKKQGSVLFMVYSWPPNRARHTTALYDNTSWCREHLPLPISPAIQLPELCLPQRKALHRLSLLPGGGVSVNPPTLLGLSGLCHSPARDQADWTEVAPVSPNEPESHREASWEALDQTLS